jgi:quercetin dioxygenase-like cupin family protein/mannose-6-phosphate isomerase-like protein (cupin superfamily)
MKKPQLLKNASRTTLLATALCMASAVCALAGEPAPKIAMEKLDLSRPEAGIRVQAVLPGEIAQVNVALVSIAGPDKFVAQGNPQQEVVWLFLSGQGTLRVREHSYQVEGEMIAHAPSGWSTEIEAASGQMLHALCIRRMLTDEDLQELKRFPENNAAPWIKKFSDCKPYGEAIKSAKTVSRTLLPENIVPRMAIGTVETTGPDRVGIHRHAMLEQLFLGLKGNDITVLADASRANLKEFSILHIPLGSNHGAEVADGKKLYYVWMDFFATKAGQEWLKMHKPVVDSKP